MKKKDDLLALNDAQVEDFVGDRCMRVDGAGKSGTAWGENGLFLRLPRGGGRRHMIVVQTDLEEPQINE